MLSREKVVTLLKSKFKPFFLRIHFTFEGQKVPAMEYRAILFKVVRFHEFLVLGVYFLIEAAFSETRR